MKSGLRVLFAFIAILFLDALLRSMKLGGDTISETVDRIGQMHAKRFYAQRNLYLTGFTLSLAFVVGRYFKRVCRCMELQEQLIKVDSVSADRRQATVAQQRKLESCLAELEALKARIASADAVLKQAKAQQDEYNRLADKYAELEQKLRKGETSKNK